MRTLYNIHHNIKHDSLIKEPVVVTVRNFDEKAYEDFNEDFDKAHRTGQTVIPVVIDSYGGQAYSLMGMIGIIQSSKIPVITILLSKAMSCGSILFSFGEERYIAPYSTLMIHDVASLAWGKIEEIKADVKEAKRLNNIVYEMFDRNCNQPKGFFKGIVHDKGHADWYIDAKEAIKLNLATKIGIPALNVSVKMDYNISL